MRRMIPEPLKPHRVDVYLLEGQTPAGSKYTAPAKDAGTLGTHCLVEDKIRSVRTPSGDAVQSSRAVYLDQLEVPLHSEVDYLGDRRDVVATAQARVGHRLAHTVLYLA